MAIIALNFLFFYIFFNEIKKDIIYFLTIMTSFDLYAIFENSSIME